jgi:hypothetical protein
MVFERCSDVADLRVEHAILDAESRRNAASNSDSEQPRRASPFGGTRTSDNDSLCRAGLSIEELGDLSNGQRNKSKPARLEQLPKSKRRSVIMNSSGIEIRPWSN